MDTLLTLARASPLFIIVIGFYITIITGNPIGVYFSIAAIIVEVVNKLLKYTTKEIAGENDWFSRPSPPPFGCSVYPKKDDVSYGMPSGHSMIICFAAAFWIKYIFKYSDMDNYSKYVSSCLLIGTAVLVMYSRIYDGCHNLSQVSVGAILGVILGVITFNIIS